LKASARNCRRIFSQMEKTRKIEKSRLFVPGPRPARR
jgi:hypothetical protein